MRYEKNRRIIRAATSGEDVSPEELVKAGNALFASNRGSHVCYQNDNFYVAAICGLDERRLRFAAAQALNNGLIGYWEWKTHAGWDMQIALQKLEISDYSIPDISTNRLIDYDELRPTLCQKLTEKFQLPWRGIKTEVEPHAGDKLLKSDLRQWWRGGVSPGKRFVAFDLGH